MIIPTFALVVLSISFSLSSAQPDFRFSYCNNAIGNYTNSSTFATNLDSLLSSITQLKEDDAVFHNLTAGGDNSGDQVYAITLCQGDLGSSDCSNCISDAGRKIRSVCPVQKEAIGWYTNCWLRYSSNPIVGKMVEAPGFAIYNTANASDPDDYDAHIAHLLRRLEATAAGGGSRRKFAAGSERVSDFVSVYALVECTPDLSEMDCESCIEGAMGFVQNCCYAKQAVYVGLPSCVVKFDNYQFFNGSAIKSLSPSPSPSPPSPVADDGPAPARGTGKGNKREKRVIAVVVPTVMSIVLVALLSCCYCRRKRWKVIDSSPAASKTKDEIQNDLCLQFDFRTIRVGTNNFSDDNRLGQGGFGVVYKGMLPNGQQIAVKRLAKNSGQGSHEFKNEVLLLAKLRHRNLVRLVGFCVERGERLLVYEFLLSGSLDHILFDPVKRVVLDWQTRYKIIRGVARGLLYLHEDSQLRIIHRDLKAGNILLDEEMDPKISDFGMARLFQMDQTQGDTNRIVGTYGYMAPEYALHGLFSAKSDVYSFGVLVLEIISGQRSVGMYEGENSNNLISSVWRNWRAGNAMNTVDETILSKRLKSEVMRCIHIGLLCVQEDATDRPTMSSVVVMLSSRSSTLPMPSYPAYVTHSMTPMVRFSEENGSERKCSGESRRKSEENDSERESSSESQSKSQSKSRERRVRHLPV